MFSCSVDVEFRGGLLYQLASGDHHDARVASEIADEHREIRVLDLQRAIKVDGTRVTSETRWMSDADMCRPQRSRKDGRGGRVWLRHGTITVGP